MIRSRPATMAEARKAEATADFRLKLMNHWLRSARADRNQWTRIRRLLAQLDTVPVPTLPRVASLETAEALTAEYRAQLLAVAGSRQARLEAARKVYDLIAETYPWLAGLCHQKLLAEWHAI